MAKQSSSTIINPSIMGIVLAVALFAPGSAYALTLDEMFANIRDQIAPFTQLLTGFAYLAGFWLMFRAVFHLKQYGEARTMMSSNADLKGPLVSIFIAVLLIYIPTAFKISLITAFGTDNPTAYQDGGTGWDDMAETLIIIVRFVGYIAFIRGLFQFHRLGQGQAQQGTFGRGILHIVGGVLAINVVGFTDLLFQTVGIS